MSKTYKIEGMSCGGCVSAIENTLQSLLRAESTVSIDLDSGLMTVEGEESTDVIINAIEEAGFGCEEVA